MVREFPLSSRSWLKSSQVWDPGLSTMARPDSDAQ